MSKRKSRAKSMFIDNTDIEFPDDSDVEIDLFTKPQKTQVTAIVKESKATGSRISARGKKEKKIYDPSDSGPGNKKKKEDVAAIKKLISTPSKSPAKSTSTPAKSPLKPLPIKSPAKLTVVNAKRKLDMDPKESAAAPLEKVQKITPPPPAAKEPSKRIQSRKEKSTEVESSSTEVVAQKPPQPAVNKTIRTRRSASISTASGSEQTSSTVPVRDNKIPDVSKWKPRDVADYFYREGFDLKDANKFKEQEIDGETLLILQRDDLTNLNLKVGVYIKMWHRILKFQTGN